MTNSALSDDEAITIVERVATPLLVRGAAGSGKSTLICERCLRLLDQGMAPERVVVLTPSRAHAEAIRAALDPRLGHGEGEPVVATAAELAATVLRRMGVQLDLADTVLGRAERTAMLAARIDELPLSRHDFGSNTGALLARIVRRIDRLKAELIDVGAFATWAKRQPSLREREFAELFAAHDRILREQGACDDAGLVRVALDLLGDQAPMREPFGHVLIDDAQELSLGAATLAIRLAQSQLTVAGDPRAALTCFRGAGAERLRAFELPGTQTLTLSASYRCRPVITAAARMLLGDAIDDLDAAALTDEAAAAAADNAGTAPVEFWRCESQRAQTQAVAAEIEHLVTDQHVPAGRIGVLVGDLARTGRAVSVALAERALPHQLIGGTTLFERAEVRDVLAWLRLLCDPGDASAVVRALARAPVRLREIDIARCTQIARRHKLDLVSAVTAALQSPQVPPEARERLHVFLELYRALAPGLDTLRPDLYVHNLIERLGLRRAQLFSARADVVERLRALARVTELAAGYASRSPQASTREFARNLFALAQHGLSEHQEPDLTQAGVIQVLALDAAGGLELQHAFVVGVDASLERSPALDCEPVPDELLHEQLPPDGAATRHRRLAQWLYVAGTRASTRVVFTYALDAAGGFASDSFGKPLASLETTRAALGCAWREVGEDQPGLTQWLDGTLRALRDELMDGTLRTATRIAELRLDTDLDIAHAVVRYLEVLKLTALSARGELDDQEAAAAAIREINARISQALTAAQREIFTSSPLDAQLLDGAAATRSRAHAFAAREEPSLAHFLPTRGDGVMLSATDIDTYRACPLRYKFARVFRIPRAPTLNQRFGIAVHQVLERYHARADGELGPLAELLALLDQSWRTSGFSDSDQERQLYDKAVRALTRYHERTLDDPAQPVWFERQFSFHIGAHLVRGRVDRVDRLPSGEYELIDYKTGRPKSPEQLADDVQLSLYALGAREAWGLESAYGAYYYLLDDQKVAVSGGLAERSARIAEIALQVAEGIKSEDFEPTPSPAVCRLCDYRLICPAVEH